MLNNSLKSLYVKNIIKVVERNIQEKTQGPKLKRSSKLLTLQNLPK